MEVTEEDLDKYSRIGTSIGKVVTGFIKELGISKAGWGIIMTIMIAWHYFGSDISLIMMSLILSVMFFPIWTIFVRVSLFEYVDKEFKKKNNETEIRTIKVFNEKSFKSIQGSLAVWSLFSFIFLECLLMINIG